MLQGSCCLFLRLRRNRFVEDGYGVERERLSKVEMIMLTDHDFGIDNVSIPHGVQLMGGYGQYFGIQSRSKIWGLFCSKSSKDNLVYSLFCLTVVVVKQDLLLEHGPQSAQPNPNCKPQSRISGDDLIQSVISIPHRPIPQCKTLL